MFEVWIIIACFCVAVYQMIAISNAEKAEEIERRENILLLLAAVAAVMLLSAQR